MGFTKPDFPDVDPDTFMQKPLMERMRILATDWVDNGFGSPKMVHTIYIAKLVFSYALGGVLVAMWNYMGWDNASTIAQEVERPQRTYPKAMIAAVVLVSATYVLPFVAVYFTGIPAATFGEDGSWAAV